MAAEDGALSATLDKVLFVSKVHLLLKATTDDGIPTPGYMYQEISDLSLVSVSYCQTLLEYLVDRLDKDSYHVKRKVLRILLYIVENGHPDFREGLRRNSRGIKEATKYNGPPDPLNGLAPYLTVRKAAKDLLQVLFDISDTQGPKPQPVTLKSTGGMGNMTHGSDAQGFGNVQNRPQKSLGEAIVSGLRELADRVVEPQDLRWTAAKTAADQFEGGVYEPVQLANVTGSHETSRPGDQENPAVEPQPQQPVQPTIPHKPVVAHRPGVAGGGWEEDIDYLEFPLPAQTSSSTLEVSVGDSTASRQSTGAGDSTGSTELNGRFENMQNDNWNAEEHLVTEFVEKVERTLPSRNDINSFIKKCGELNCEKVVSLLNSHLSAQPEPKAMRVLMVMDLLMHTDLVTVDRLAEICASNLVLVYKAAHGQAKAKARKVLRQLQLLTSRVDLFNGMPPMARDHPHNTATQPPTISQATSNNHNNNNNFVTLPHTVTDSAGSSAIPPDGDVTDPSRGHSRSDQTRVSSIPPGARPPSAEPRSGSRPKEDLSWSPDTQTRNAPEVVATCLCEGSNVADMGNESVGINLIRFQSAGSGGGTSSTYRSSSLE